MPRLQEYFDSTKGFSVLSTADENGNVNAAVYSRPHVMADGTLAVVMNDRLSHKNVLATRKAHFLFRENTTGYKGKRLTLSMLREEEDTDLLFELCRRCKIDEEQPTKRRFLVFFKVDRELPLIGSGEV
jgi:hypothetical protein